MQHIVRLEDADVDRPVTLSIGSFDGVHRGHQYLIAQLVESARADGHIPAVMTFYPHPRLVLRGWEPGYYLTGPNEKAALLGRYGAELVITHPFDDHVRQMRAREFVERLKRHLHLADLWVGPDFALGYGREGNARFLEALGAEIGYRLHVIEHKLSWQDREIGSGRIREALRAGDVRAAAEMLGRPYELSGTVVHGEQRGRRIGIPTANLDVPAERAVPGRGVYSTWARFDGRRYAAVTNVGVRPTFDGSHAGTIEAHLLDFDGDLYGQTLTLDFVARIRDERRFSGIDELVAQIRRDIEEGRAQLVSS